MPTIFHRLKYLIPKSFTAFSMILGLASIYNSTQGQYDLAAWMIVWGVLLDKLDGTSARLFNASSDLGAELDSFADFVSFGLAVAALMFFSLREMSLVHPGWLVASSCVYVVAIAVLALILKGCQHCIREWFLLILYAFEPLNFSEYCVNLWA